jgi:hypothetical protein
LKISLWINKNKIKTINLATINQIKHWINEQETFDFLLKANTTSDYLAYFS